ncbi:MAG: type II toxin-antitoxin system VapB family antitoxin [Methylobacterium frigidaeris]
MADRLIIDDDEAVGLARDLAERLGTTPDEVVVRALRSYGEDRASAQAQHSGYEALHTLAKQAARNRRPGAISDHADLYDGDGLPV